MKPAVLEIMRMNRVCRMVLVTSVGSFILVIFYFQSMLHPGVAVSHSLGLVIVTASVSWTLCKVPATMTVAILWITPDDLCLSTFLPESDLVILCGKISNDVLGVPNIQSNPFLPQLENISSSPVTCYPGEETNPYLTIPSFQAIISLKPSLKELIINDFPNSSKLIHCIGCDPGMASMLLILILSHLIRFHTSIAKGRAVGELGELKSNQAVFSDSISGKKLRIISRHPGSWVCTVTTEKSIHSPVGFLSFPVAVWTMLFCSFISSQELLAMSKQ
ncbi:hypothetical protein BTVI_132135 [Pitangus sulphuratus]|nr:hypothetical protein BTVI_132135 [Pitangus sulphuratus]